VLSYSVNSPLVMVYSTEHIFGDIFTQRGKGLLIWF